MMHLWEDGYDYFWKGEDFEPRSRDYSHSRFCPCKTGVKPEWTYSDIHRTYVPVGSETVGKPAK